MTDTDPLTDPSSCGSCRHHVAQGRAVLHEQCIARARLIPAPDAPCYETILDTPEDQRAQLPARFHIPMYDDVGTPKSWSCAVCWGDGWSTRWPCATALENGRDVFTPEHLADQARQDMPALLAEIDRIRAELATAREQAAPVNLARPCTACHHSRFSHTVPTPHSCVANGQTCDCPAFADPLTAAAPTA
jgi:hypothetical protein